jgi:hypothetical protein
VNTARRWESVVVDFFFRVEMNSQCRQQQQRRRIQETLNTEKVRVIFLMCSGTLEIIQEGQG